MSAIPPATLEGWFALHQVFTTDWTALRRLKDSELSSLLDELRDLFQELAAPEEGGWSAPFRLVGGGADWLFVHFRPFLDDLNRIELRLRRSRPGDMLRLHYDFLSVTEAGLYHATAEAASEAEPGSDAFDAALRERVDAERRSPHIRTRLYPTVPEDMRYVSFYPMNKRRAPHPVNWYSLTIDERNRLMRDHGMTGRRFAGRVFQVITGAVGLDDWEWGVTLFARDPLEFKRIVTEMRYDEVSAVYGEFGEFYTGIRVPPEDWPSMLGRGSAAP